MARAYQRGLGLGRWTIPRAGLPRRPDWSLSALRQHRRPPPPPARCTTHPPRWPANRTCCAPWPNSTYANGRRRVPLPARWSEAETPPPCEPPSAPSRAGCTGRRATYPTVFPISATGGVMPESRPFHLRPTATPRRRRPHPDGDVASVMARGRSRRRYRAARCRSWPWRRPSRSPALWSTARAAATPPWSAPVTPYRRPPPPAQRCAGVRNRWPMTSATPPASAGPTEYALSTRPGRRPHFGASRRPRCGADRWLHLAVAPDPRVVPGRPGGQRRNGIRRRTGTATAATANVLSGGVKVASSAEGKGE